ncbi:MAG: hypothetical protein AABX00_00625 [Nanoarchaeota archaeon]
MTNLTHEVWNYLDSEPSIKKELSRGIVNIMALAKYIIDTKNLEKSPDAVISAIRRYVLEERHAPKFHNVEDIIKNSRISTKNKIALIAIKRDSTVLDVLPNVFPLIELSRGEVMRLSEGKESLKLLVDEKNLQKIADVFPKNKIIGITRNLSELSINLGPGSIEAVGVLATIMNELAVNNISIVEVIGCLPEFMLFFDSKDILKAHEILMKLSGI